MDTSRNVNPVTFMSNMLYACSILYKSKLPFVIVMNKVKMNKCFRSVTFILKHFSLTFYKDVIKAEKVLSLILIGSNYPISQ